MASLDRVISDVGSQIPKLVLLAVVVAVLLPATNYSINLSNPTPSQLLVAISIGVFSSTLCLWLMDAVGVLTFRSEWVSRGIYGAAIVSILSTGVGVSHGALSERKYQYEGKWEVLIGFKGELISGSNVVLSYSTRAETYWGYSQPTPIYVKEKPTAIEILDLDISGKKITYQLYYPGGSSIYQLPIEISNNGKNIYSTKENDHALSLSRPK